MFSSFFTKITGSSFLTSLSAFKSWVSFSHASPLLGESDDDKTSVHVSSLMKILRLSPIHPKIKSKLLSLMYRPVMFWLLPVFSAPASPHTLDICLDMSFPSLHLIKDTPASILKFKFGIFRKLFLKSRYMCICYSFAVVDM